MVSIDDRYYLSFRWGPRRESLEGCALRLRLYINALISLFPKSEWNVLSRSSVSATKRTRPANYQDVLSNGTNKGSKRLPIPDLGFRVSITSNSDIPFDISRVHCGSYAGGIYNVCTIDFGFAGLAGSRIGFSPLLIKLTMAIIDAWAPDHGLLSSQKLNELCESSSPEAEAGWLTYLSKDCEQVADAPVAFSFRNNAGRLLAIEADEFLVTSKPQVSAILKLRSLLSHRL